MHIARKQAESRAFSTHGRDAFDRAADFMRISRIRCRKAAWHGLWRARGTRDRNSLDGERGHLGTCARNLRRKKADRISCSGDYLLRACVDTVRARCYGGALFPARILRTGSIVMFRRKPCRRGRFSPIVRAASARMDFASECAPRPAAKFSAAAGAKAAASSR